MPDKANIAEAAPSAFGFDLSGSGEAENANDSTVNQSAFGFDLSAEKKEEDKQEKQEEMTLNGAEYGGVSPILTATSSPPPSLDNSVSSQLKRAEQQHERSRKRIWSQIKQCIERQLMIKERESEFNAKLLVENEKKMEAENAKKIALQNADFEEAEKTKNAIRRAMKNISDINHQLTKCGVDLKKMNMDKSQQEQVYVTKSKAYKEKLDVLYGKHESSMIKSIDDEFKRIEKEEKKYKEKLDRTEREIQLDDENIEKCKDKLEEIEDCIKNDVEPFQENLDKHNAEKIALKMEIDELNKQLLAKKSELNDVENSIDESNNEIMKVRKEYKDQMDEILEEQSRYELSKKKFNLQKNEYVLTLNSLNDDNQKNKRIEEEFENELNGLKLKISRINDSFERFEEKKIKQNEWSTEEQQLLDNQQKLDKKLDDIKYEIEKYEKELKKIDSKSIHHRQTIGTIDSALPILHSDKRTAVNNENYLEAGKIHKQILHKTAQKDKSLEQLKALNDKREEIKQKLRDEQGQSVQLKNELENIRMKIHNQRFQLVMDHKSMIMESLEALNNDHNIKDDDVEKTVLKLELNQIQSELEFFNEKYGWNVDEKPNVDNLDIVAPTNNAEEHEEHHHDKQQQQEEEEKENQQIEEIKKPKTKDEIVEELEKIKNEIVAKEAEKEEVQNNINKAVANDQFDVAGKLAPNKKQLISKVNDLKKKREELENELNEINNKETEEVEDNDTLENMISNDTKTDETGYNGIVTQKEEENEQNEVVETTDIVQNNITDDNQSNEQNEHDEHDEHVDKEKNSNDGLDMMQDEDDTVNID